jgi:capsular polysaccharide transport system permease protein
MTDHPITPAADKPKARPQGETSRSVRSQRARRLALKLSAFVLLPSVIAATYLWAFATDAYESVALFSIQAAENRPTVAMESLIGMAGVSSAGRDTLATRDFLLSREMMNTLDERLQLLEHYRSPKIDFFSRLAVDASREDAFEYYQDRVRVSFDSNSSMLTLRVRAYTAEKARAIAAAILEESEAKVNRLSEKARRDQIRIAQDEVKLAETRLVTSRQALVDLQQKHGQFSPEQSAAAAMSIRTELESKLAEARAEYATLSSYMAPTSPQVIAARERVSALATQAKGESARLVDARDDKGLNKSLVEFEAVLVEKEFATQSYQSALTSLELARADATRQHRYLAVVAEPSLPDEAMFPRRVLSLLTTFLSSLVLFGVFSLTWAAIKEHAKL